MGTVTSTAVWCGGNLQSTVLISKPWAQPQPFRTRRVHSEQHSIPFTFMIHFHFLSSHSFQLHLFKFLNNYCHIEVCSHVGDMNRNCITNAIKRIWNGSFVGICGYQRHTSQMLGIWTPITPKATEWPLFVCLGLTALSAQIGYIAP